MESDIGEFFYDWFEYFLSYQTGLTDTHARIRLGYTSDDIILSSDSESDDNISLENRLNQVPMLCNFWATYYFRLHVELCSVCNL